MVRMKIKTVKLQNFHGFKEKQISFSKGFTVLIGDNATGKTAILDGLAVALGGFLSGFDGVKTSIRHINDDEVYRKKTEYGYEPLYPVIVNCTAQIDGQLVKWERSLNGEGGKTTRQKATKIIKYAKKLQKDIRGDTPVTIPVISYFGTGRLGAEKREKHIEPFQTGSRLLGYLDCLSPISNTKLFTKWLKKVTYIYLQQSREPIELATVKTAIKSCLKSLVKEPEQKYVDIYYDVKEDEVVVTLGENQNLPFRMLSDGYRNMIGMVADIAFRMAVLNPHHEKDVINETSGIVLIDEIDLHLHPKWQRHVVDDLKRTFPKVQFIATTHSPFIVQSLDEGELRILDDIPGGDYVDKSIEDVTESVMGVDLPQWSIRRQKMYKAAEEYYQTLQELKSNPKKTRELQVKLDELTKPFADNIAYVAFLEQERLAVSACKRRRKLKGEKDETSS